MIQPSVRKLRADDGPLQLSLFDQQDLAEITSPDFAGQRIQRADEVRVLGAAWHVWWLRGTLVAPCWGFPGCGQL